VSELEDKLVAGLSMTGYVCHQLHTVLGDDAHRERGPNIGRNGANLTVMLLSLNRSGLTLRLLESIARHVPGFAGEVLIADNGSEPAELAVVRNACAALPFRSRILALGQNYGVAGGRNRAMREVRTDWALSLDNDIYFVGDPLPSIQADIAILGCHFLNLPLLDSDGKTLFARGGHLYVSEHNGELQVGGGSACRPEKMLGRAEQPFLSTFLFGGASVLNRHTFARLGGFDEGMFVGFEDTDFSIRLFREGLKIGNTTVETLVHDHPKPESGVDRDYERQRFAREVLRRSAEHLEKKHGFRVWNDAVNEWLRTRHEELGLHTEAPDEPIAPAKPVAAPTGTISSVHRRARIVLVPDTSGWAFSNIAAQVERNLGKRFDFLTVPADTMGDDRARLLLLSVDYDLVHFFWRPEAFTVSEGNLRGYADALGMEWPSFHERYVGSRVFTTAVYDHLFLDREAKKHYLPLFRDLVSAYYVSSQRLAQIYRDIPGYPAPAAVLEDGVDLELFKPRRLERFRREGRELVVGWAGNSKWAKERHDSKGVNTILRPAIDELRREGLPIRTRFADRAERQIGLAEMPAYYSTIDVYVCASEMEGTPNPVLESMACGVPVISTNVGVVPEAFGKLQSQFMLRDRSIETLKRALRRLFKEQHLLAQLSAENLSQIREWDWTKKAQGFASFFERALRR
jgi:glycosyltransferase involved in cell wall biosynthesis